MNNDQAVAEAPQAIVENSPGARPFPWIPIAWFAGLVLLLFYPVIRPMVQEWIDMEEMGHGFFVPVVVAYIIWKDRERIMKEPVKPNWWGLALVGWGFLQMLLGFAGADFFVARTALIVSLVGVAWTLLGTAILKRMLFPLFLLVFMIRIPLFLYQQITFPLQIFASTLAEHALSGIGIPVLRDGNILELPSQRLQVVEACSGIRSLLSLTFLAFVYAYFFDDRPWMRPVLFLATIPIAIFANAMRVTLTGILSEFDKELAEGIYHTLEGWVIFMVALVCLVAVHRLIGRFAKPAEA